MDNANFSTPDTGGNAANEINRLHTEIVDSLRSNLPKALRIGELLDEVKAGLPHGEFGAWCKANLPFTDRTARNYLRLHRHRDRLKTETVSDLGDAYRLLTESKAASTLDAPPNAILYYSDAIGNHTLEEWEPHLGETVMGIVGGEDPLIIECVDFGQPTDEMFVRLAVMVGDPDCHVHYTKRGINRHWLRWTLQTQFNIDPDQVDWIRAVKACAETNIFKLQPYEDDLVEWTYPEVAA